MLISFKVGNYKSIKQTEISMHSHDGGDLPQNLISLREDHVQKGFIMKSAAIYGANASGKSNFIKAIRFLKNLIIESKSLNHGQTFNLSSFKFDQFYQNKPTTFEIIVLIDSIKYRYIVSLNKERILQEEIFS
jgi:AAA15 family ATPase/GTPase